MSMIKADLANLIWQKHGNLSQHEALLAVNAIWNNLKKKLMQGEDVQINGFGRFAVCRHAAKVGRNINKGISVQIPARKVVVFKPSRQLKELVNKQISTE